jgi:outer membrane protein assembly factor BamD (BamD/ComL family)
VESEAAKHAAAALPTRELGAVELFDAESHARRRGEYVRALSLHRELEARFGLSKEAQASRAVTGRLLLDRGNADAALACFDSYLASGSGDLGEEVLVGRATALEKLSQMDEARAAWQDLLERFPTTPYAPHAKARLGI